MHEYEYEYDLVTLSNCAFILSSISIVNYGAFGSVCFSFIEIIFFLILWFYNIMQKNTAVQETWSNPLACSRNSTINIVSLFIINISNVCLKFTPNEI
jgi:hypothetical protein